MLFVRPLGEFPLISQTNMRSSIRVCMCVCVCVCLLQNIVITLLALETSGNRKLHMLAKRTRASTLAGMQQLPMEVSGESIQKQAAFCPRSNSLCGSLGLAGISTNSIE